MRKFNISVNGNTYEVEVEEVGGVAAPVQKSAAPAPKPVAPKAVAPKSAAAPVAGGTTISAPMPGTIVAVKVSTGDTVNEGDVLCVLEAMKMENEIMAPTAGKITAVCVGQGASVNTGDALISIG